MTTSKRLFGTDGIRGTANVDPMTAEVALQLGQAAGLMFVRGSHRHRVVIGKDTRLSGYMIEPALVAGLHRRGHGRDAGRPAADAGDRDADAKLAGRPGRDGVGLAQRVRGQRHQAVRPRRVQAVGRDGARDRAADGRRTGRVGSPPPDRLGRASRLEDAGRALHRGGEGDVSARADARGLQDRGRLRERRGLSRRADGAVGAGRRHRPGRRRAGRVQHQQGLRLDRAGPPARQGGRARGRSRHRARWRRGPADPGGRDRARWSMATRSSR